MKLSWSLTSELTMLAASLRIESRIEVAPSPSQFAANPMSLRIGKLLRVI